MIAPRSGFSLLTLVGFVVGSAILVFLVVWLFALHKVVTPPSYVTVLKDEPWIFGHGGVQKDVQQPGLSWKWVTTRGIDVPSFAFKIDEPFDDLPTKMQSFIDFRSYLKVRITDPVLMVKGFRFDGVDGPTWLNWYAFSIKEQYRSAVRNEARMHLMEDILSNPDTITTMEANIRKVMDAEIKKAGIPVVLEDLSLGRASPNGPVMAEIDVTAAQQQRIKSETARKLAEDARKQAELARAEADNAYRQKMDMSSNQYVQLEVAKQYANACAATKNCLVINGNAPVVVGAH